MLESAGKGTGNGFLRFHTLKILLLHTEPLSITDIKTKLEAVQPNVKYDLVQRILAEIEALHPLMELTTHTLRPPAAHRKPTQYYSLTFNR